MTKIFKQVAVLTPQTCQLFPQTCQCDGILTSSYSFITLSLLGLLPLYQKVIPTVSQGIRITISIFLWPKILYLFFNKIITAEKIF